MSDKTATKNQAKLTAALLKDAETKVKTNYGHGWNLIGETAQANALAAELLNVLRFAVQMDTVDNLGELVTAFSSRVSEVRYAE